MGKVAEEATREREVARLNPASCVARDFTRLVSCGLSMRFYVGGS
jgi:hypothetical protein